MISNVLPVFDAQSDMLSFVAQQAIAHSAAIFATLTAAFTFAYGFKRTQFRDNDARTFYVVLLAFLLALSTYSALRLYYYGVLSGVIPTLPAQPNNLTIYWGKAVNEASSNKIVYLGLTQSLSSYAFSWLIGFAIAAFITYHLVEVHEPSSLPSVRYTLLPCQGIFDKLPLSWRTIWKFGFFFLIANTILAYGVLKPGPSKTLVLGIPYFFFGIPTANLIAAVISFVATMFLVRRDWHRDSQLGKAESGSTKTKGTGRRSRSY